LRLRLPRRIDLAGLVELVAAEQECCPFFTFTVTVNNTDVVLEVGAPADARELVDALLGEPSGQRCGTPCYELGCRAPDGDDES
jgi:MerR family copper efflux transcriptional regulator